MNLISMATTGLSEFASNISNTVVKTVSSMSNAIASYTGNFNNVVGTVSGLVNAFSGQDLTNMFKDTNGYSNAGTFRAGGNSRDNSIFDFLTNFKKGIMKSSRFRAEFNLPKGVSSKNAHSVNGNALASRIKTAGNGFNGTGAINVKCHQAMFPARAISTLDFRSNSVPFKIPYMTSYDPITISFYADGNMDSRSYFELWQSCIMNFGNNTLNYYNEYVSDVKLYVQNDYGEDTYGIILYEAYPIQIGVFDVASSNQNMPLTIMITLSYKAWLPLSNSNVTAYNRTV